MAHPDLVVVADASLLGDPAARVSEGVTDQAVLFINSPLSAEQIRTQSKLPGRVTTLDVTKVALEHFGQRDAISALLGAVAARLAGIEQEPLQHAIARELGDLGISMPVIERNQTAAMQCYEAVPAVRREPGAVGEGGETPLHTPVYESPCRGTARISASGNSVLRETGGWRTFRPVLVADKCNGCWLCFVYCPDGVISMNKDDRPVIDYDHCKGCQICVHECPTHALVAEREQEGGVAWTAR